MKRLIILKSEYNESSGKNKAEEYKSQVAICKSSVKEFRAALNKDVKIVRVYDILPQVIIEFADKLHDKVYDELRKIDIVESIDCYLPKEE
jgi:hypothetical protein